MAQTFATVRPVVRHEHMILGGDGARLSLECGRTRILVFEQMERLGEITHSAICDPQQSKNLASCTIEQAFTPSGRFHEEKMRLRHNKSK